jgi:hypothetical protein
MEQASNCLNPVAAADDDDNDDDILHDLKSPLYLSFPC